MSDTRGPRTGKVPPHVAERLQDKRRRAEVRATRGAWWQRGPSLAIFALLALLIGLGIGLGLGSDPVDEAAQTVAAEVVPLANEADAAWNVGVGGGPPVGQAVQQLGTTGDASVVAENLDTWLSTYDDVLQRFDEVEVDPAGESLTDLFRSSVALMRDAVATAGAAAAAEGDTRQQLLAQVAVLRARSLGVLRDARTDLEAMGGPAAPVTDVPGVPPLPRPGGAASPEPTTEPTPEPTAEPTPEATAS